MWIGRQPMDVKSSTRTQLLRHTGQCSSAACWIDDFAVMMETAASEKKHRVVMGILIVIC